MIDFDKNMASHRFEVDNLFRSYQLNGRTDIEKARAGFDQYGEGFIMKLLSITVPKDHRSHYETTLEAKLPDPYVVGLQAPTLYTVDPAGATTATASTGKGWAFFEKLLGAGVDASAAIGTAMGNLSSPAQTAQQSAAAQQIEAQNASSSKILYIVAGVFLAGILLIAVLKK